MQLNKKVIVRTALCAVLVGALGYSFVAKSEFAEKSEKISVPKLLPFQGKLTDANGQVVKDGTILVEFRMFDDPEKGLSKWNGERQMLTVNNGFVSTTLGTKASLQSVDFSTPTYLEIRIDANGDNKIDPEDPPLLPRQSIIPAVYAVEAGNAQSLNGKDWSSIFGENNPELKIPGDKIKDQEITAAQIKDRTITAQQMADSTITSAKLASGSVTRESLIKEIRDSLVPPGTIIAFGGENVPDGWMECDGRPLSSKDYPALYQAIGKNWGSGAYLENDELIQAPGCDFNVPQLHGAFLRGWNKGLTGVLSDPDASSRFAIVNGVSGDHVGSYQSDMFGVHVHSLDDYVFAENGGDDRGMYGSNKGGDFDNSPKSPFRHDTFSSGGNETRPKNAYVFYIIKCDTKILDDNPVFGKAWIASLKPGVNLEMNWVEPGTFTMGSPGNETGHNNTESQHLVTLTKGFWLGKYEVTQAQWYAVMETDPSHFKGSLCPVEHVSWNNAMEFCKKLTEKERAAGRLSNQYEYTLPTEAQWEYACRAGTTTALNNGKEFSESNLNEIAWYGDGAGDGGSANGVTHIVGQKKANAWGFYDMSGNVWEWCLDWYEEYPSMAVTDPMGSSTTFGRVSRGGSCWWGAECCRSANRAYRIPEFFDNNWGFRLALVPVQ